MPHWYDALRSLREARGLSMSDVERLTGEAGSTIYRSQLSLIESGQRPKTAHETVEAILSAIGASWSEYGKHRR